MEVCYQYQCDCGIIVNNASLVLRPNRGSMMYADNQKFHEKYYSIYDKTVGITFKDNAERVGF